MTTLATSTGEPRAGPGKPRRVTLLGQAIDCVTHAGALDLIDASLDRGQGGWVVTPNLDILRRLVVDEKFSAACAKADLRLPDGMPLVWASRLMGDPMPERVAGSDMILTLSERAGRRGRRVFFLGGNPGAADAASKLLSERHPGLVVAGTYFPPFGFEKNDDEWRKMGDELRRANPEIIFVALGSPKQEYVIERLKPEFPSAWFLGIGISFSFVSGEVKRAPVWMRKVGLEWFHRLVQEPKRLFVRYIIHGLPFAAWLFAASIWARLFRPRTASSAQSG